MSRVALYVAAIAGSMLVALALPPHPEWWRLACFIVGSGILGFACDEIGWTRATREERERRRARDDLDDA